MIESAKMPQLPVRAPAAQIAGPVQPRTWPLREQVGNEAFGGKSGTT